MLAEMTELVTWVNEEIERRGWSYSELARRAGVSSATISHLVNERKGPGLEVCLGIARAFGEIPARVLEIAKLLPPEPPAVAEEREVLALVRRIPEPERVAALKMLRGLAAQPGRPRVAPEVATDMPSEMSVLMEGYIRATPEQRAVLEALLRSFESLRAEPVLT
jgi:transcriptional regulator with XRE-family HTH domain